MAIRDAEDLIRDIRDFLKDNLNTKITAINTEKSTTYDDFTLDAFTENDSVFVIFGERGDLPNKSFVSVSIEEDVVIESNGDNVSQEIPVSINVMFSDNMKGNAYFKALRYIRALINTMVNYESETIEVSDLQITSSQPMEIQADKMKLISAGIVTSIIIA